MKSIKEAEIKKGTKVLVRVDWNVPILPIGSAEKETDAILDDSRIVTTLQTIEFIKNAGGTPFIISHFGREGDSLMMVFNFVKEKFPEVFGKAEFISDLSSDFSKSEADVFVIENLRKWEGEEKNDLEFAKQLASLSDVYVNEAFSVSHRKHASIVSVPKLVSSFIGFRFEEEFKKLSDCFNPEHPFLFILGGAKFETKLPLIEKFLKIADSIFIGGALAAKASEMEVAKDSKIIFPVGDIAALDANAETLEILKEKIATAKFVLWNGPLGNYEQGFIAGTVAISRMLAESSAKIIVGGGDTLAAVSNQATKDQISYHGFISTAGGAMLDFLATGTLPGIEALK